MAVTVTLPDGKALELADGATGADAALAIGPGLARAALAVQVDPSGEDAEVRDLARPLPDGAQISIITNRSGEAALELIRHDTAHVLAAAVMELYDGVKISIGPPIADGFYYDFEFPPGTAISEADFPAIEERMREHVKAAEAFERLDVPVDGGPGALPGRGPGLQGRVDRRPAAARGVRAAAHRLALHQRPLHRSLPRPARAEHRRRSAPSSSLGRGRLLARGLKRTMLTRIYGTAFFTKAQLEEHLERLEQARARDHRKLGRELGLFMFSDVSPGRRLLAAGRHGGLSTRSCGSRGEMGAERGYSEVKTPQIFDSELWKTSGHWGKYRENMFTVNVEDREMGVKPMNCPGHAHLYASTRHSYRDLPVRYFEPGLLHRNEASGVLHGLLRVRHFAQDDAHIFCTEEQVQEEVRACLEMAFATYRAVRLRGSPGALHPARGTGRDDEMWDRAELKLTRTLEELGLEYELNPGDGAFYGPKIDMHMTDSLGRSWQLGTVQLDYSMPERFELTYTGRTTRTIAR